MKSKLYIVRHTQTIGNLEKKLTGRCDYEITEEGNKYIEKITNRLKDIKFDVAYSSVSKRTYKTIEKLAKLNNLEIIEEENLCEMYFGIYDGMKWDEIDKINPKIRKLHIETNEIMEIPDQEKTEDVAERMYKTMLKISNKNIGKNILICSHGVAIEAFLRKISKIPFSKLRNEYSQKNTSLNIVTFDDEKQKFEIELLNDYTHL